MAKNLWFLLKSDVLKLQNMLKCRGMYEACSFLCCRKSPFAKMCTKRALMRAFCATEVSRKAARFWNCSLAALAKTHKMIAFYRILSWLTHLLPIFLAKASNICFSSAKKWIKMYLWKLSNLKIRHLKKKIGKTPQEEFGAGDEIIVLRILVLS